MFLSGSFYNQVALNGHIEASVGRLFGFFRRIPWLQRLKPPQLHLADEILPRYQTKIHHIEIENKEYSLL
jgi:hypothetical protein